jgi:hypothetical protein
MGESAPLGLLETAELVGAYRWVEHSLFELTGSWARHASSPRLALHYDEVSMQHGWHAELWLSRLPVLDSFDREAATVPLGSALGEVFDLVTAGDSEPGETAAPVGDLARLCFLYRVVVPRLLVSTRRHLHACSVASDRPTARALRLVLRDHVESWLAGESLLEFTAGAAETASVLPALQEQLERPFLEAGPLVGLVPWPGKTQEHPDGGVPKGGE